LGALAALNIFLVYKFDQFSRAEVWLAHELEVIKMREDQKRLGELEGSSSLRTNERRTGSRISGRTDVRAVEVGFPWGSKSRMAMLGRHRAAAGFSYVLKYQHGEMEFETLAEVEQAMRNLCRDRGLEPLGQHP
jgi:hypothetical protein